MIFLKLDTLLQNETDFTLYSIKQPYRANRK